MKLAVRIDLLLMPGPWGSGALQAAQPEVLEIGECGPEVPWQWKSESNRRKGRLSKQDPLWVGDVNLGLIQKDPKNQRN